MRLVIILTLSLASTQAFKIEAGDGEKVCTLEKSSTNGENCFYEPECQNVCKDVQSTVSVIQVLIVNINLYFFVIIVRSVKMWRNDK